MSFIPRVNSYAGFRIFWSGNGSLAEFTWMRFLSRINFHVRLENILYKNFVSTQNESRNDFKWFKFKFHFRISENVWIPFKRSVLLLLKEYPNNLILQLVKYIWCRQKINKRAELNHKILIIIDFNPMALAF